MSQTNETLQEYFNLAYALRINGIASPKSSQSAMDQVDQVRQHPLWPARMAAWKALYSVPPTHPPSGETPLPELPAAIQDLDHQIINKLSKSAIKPEIITAATIFEQAQDPNLRRS